MLCQKHFHLAENTLFHAMSTQDTRFQQMLKIRRTTLGFGVVQIILGIALTALSFAAFSFTSSDRIRNACPYWAGFTVFCSGGVGVIAWKHSSALSMGLFTFFSAVCVVLQMIGTILTGDAGGLLKSVVMCESVGSMCKCCDSSLACRQGMSVEFEGVDDCRIITGLLQEFIYGLCVLNIFGCLVCFIATILGCTAVARDTGRHQELCSHRPSARSQSSNQERYTWEQYPTDLTMLPPYAPPVYHSVENFQEFGITSCIVPPPVFDPTDLPPPYSSQNPSLAESQCSLSWPDSYSSGTQQQFSVFQEETEAHFQPVGNSQATNSDLESRPGTTTPCQSTPCSTPSGVMDLEGCGLPWEEQFKCASHSVDPLTTNQSTDLSPNSSRDDCCHGDISNVDSMVGGTSAHSFQVHRPSSSTSKIRPEEMCDKKLTALSSRERTSIGTTKSVVPAVVEAEVNVLPVPTPSSSPVRGTTIVSLRTRSSSLGEHSIYVNSFEVMSRPPPNVRVPDDEPALLKLDTDKYNNAKNVLKCFNKKGTAHQVTQLHFGRRRREKDRHRRRRQPLNSSKREGKLQSLGAVGHCAINRCVLAECQASFDCEASVAQGKETMV